MLLYAIFRDDVYMLLPLRYMLLIDDAMPFMFIFAIIAATAIFITLPFRFSSYAGSALLPCLELPYATCCCLIARGGVARRERQLPRYDGHYVMRHATA